MSYAPKNPRPSSIIYQHPYWSKNASRKEILTNAINRSWSKAGSLSQLSRFFDRKQHFFVLRATKSGTLSSTYTSAEIFKEPRFLPYYISPGDMQGLNSDQRAKLESVFARLSVAKTGRVPTIYRITDFTFCDDLGRIYSRGDPSAGQDVRLLYFQRFTLSAPFDFRNHTWFQSKDGDVSLAAYIGIGLAGYDPRIQQEIYNSLKFDVHHVEENKFDLRPSALLPLPTWLHLRWVHAGDRGSIEKNLFQHDQVNGNLW
uniref:Uncharacterized protein n=1 Tax=Cressdnaviricota sp. TaxID=2748378 RepID=A0A6M4B907_9VIRU|nr:hypothetical protein [Cressdnaviricota sp.]